MNNSTPHFLHVFYLLWVVGEVALVLADIVLAVIVFLKLARVVGVRRTINFFNTVLDVIGKELDDGIDIFNLEEGEGGIHRFYELVI